MSLNCDPKALADAARCFQSCIPAGMQAAVQNYILCHIAQGGGMGSGVPSGVILLWSGTIATIPQGWALCDGTNGTPDLRDRFVVGARQDNAGVAMTNVQGGLAQTGGNLVLATLTLDCQQAAAGIQISAWSCDPLGNPYGYASDGAGNFFSDYLPPFFALAYIMKL